MISVIIPMYNGESTIEKCLKALKQQSFNGKFEVIVVDDGSTDNGANLAEKLGVKVIRQKNKGPASARNNGAKIATGDIIVFTDSDCVPSESWLAEMAEPLKDKGITGVQGAYKTKQKKLIARFAQLEIESRYERMKNLNL